MSDLPIPPGATAAIYANKKWGVKTRLVPLSGTLVGNVAALAVGGNPRRLELHVVNLGTQNFWVGWDANVSNVYGIPIAAYGGMITLLVDEDGEVVTYPLWAIAAVAAAQTLAAWEVAAI